MKELRIILWVAVLISGALLLFALYRDGGAPSSRSGAPVMTESGQFGGPFELTAHTGKPFSSDQLAGQYRLMYFGYSYCPDACPIDLAKIAATLKQLDANGVDTSQIQPLFISIDPARDTADQLAGYVELFHPRLIGLTGSDQEIASVAKDYGVYYRKVDSDDSDGYLMDHLIAIFFIGPDGDLIRLFSKADDVDTMVAAITREMDR